MSATDTRSYEDFENVTVKITVDRPVGMMLGGEWVQVDQVDAGEIGVAYNRTNAGFRGLEWSVRFPGEYGERVVHGVSGTHLERVYQQVTKPGRGHR